MTDTNNNTFSVLDKSLPNIPENAQVTTIIIKGDSAAIDHYFRAVNTNCLTDIQSSTSQPIILPNKTTISATHQGTLPLHPSLSLTGRTAKKLPQLRSSSLISIGKLSDDGYNTEFDKTSLHVQKMTI